MSARITPAAPGHRRPGAGHVWLAEVPGRFDEVGISADGDIATRLI